MSIVEKEIYVLICNNCGKEYCNDTHQQGRFENERDSMYFAIQDGWTKPITDNKEWFCPICSKNNEREVEKEKC